MSVSSISPEKKKKIVNKVCFNVVEKSRLHLNLHWNGPTVICLMGPFSWCDFRAILPLIVQRVGPKICELVVP